MKKCLRGLLVIAFSLGLPGGAFIGLPTIAAQGISHSLSKPMPVPDFSLENLQGKREAILAYKGKVLLLNFWATW